jgi:very-short-patch-repair endonuclease
MQNQRRSRARSTAEKDVALAELADRQHGVVAWRQLRELGLAKAAIRHRAQTGRLHRLQPGVYAVGRRIVTRQGWWMAAVLSSGPGAVLSHHSAAALWGMRGYSERAVEVTTRQKSTSSKRTRRHHCHLPADEVTIEEGIPVTTAPRTILDLAATESADVVEGLLREAEFRRLWDRLSLLDLVERHPGRRGLGKVRAALERVKREPAGRPRSRLEDRFAPFLRLHRLPLPRFNDWIVLDDKRFQVDCRWPGTRHIVELDGWEAHGSRSAFREDRGRDRRLRAAGYLVTRLTWNQLDDEPLEIAQDLREILGRENSGPAEAPARRR